MSVQAPLGATGTGGAFPVGARGDAIGRRGALALGSLVAGTLTIAVAAPATDSLLPLSTRPAPAWLAGPFAGNAHGLGPAALIAVLLAVLGAYLAAVVLAERLPARAVLGTIVGVHAIVLLAPPLLSTDVFSYQAYGRMWAEYGINPYLHGPRAIALDPLYPFIGAKWVAMPSAYGPLFTLLSALFGSVSIAASVVAFRSLAALASLGTVALLWRSARLRGVDPVRAVALFGLNPLVVIYGVGGGHNDLLMLLAATAAVNALLTRRAAGGGATLVLAAGLKLTAAAIVPFALASRELAGRGRRELLLGAGTATLLLAGVTGAAFGTGPLRLPAILADTQSAGDGHSLSSVIVTRLDLDTLGHAVGVGLAAACVAACGWLLARVWRGSMDWLAAAAWSLLAMLAAAGSLMPWYAAWPLPLVALCHHRRLWRAALVVTTVVMVLQLPDYIPHGITLPGL